MFGGVFVEDGVSVVDVEQDFPTASVGRELREKAIRTRERDMTNFGSGFLAAASLLHFVAGPEGAVDQNEISGSGGLWPFGASARKGRSDEDFFSGLFEE